MLHTLNNLATTVKDGTQKAVEGLNHFINYCPMHPEVVVLYNTSNMILHKLSDAAFLVATRARSRAAGYIYIFRK